MAQSQAQSDPSITSRRYRISDSDIVGGTRVQLSTGESDDQGGCKSDYCLAQG